MASDPAPPRRTRRGSGAVTLHDVAKLAGVAPITASRALNTPDAGLAEALRKKVADASRRTGYVPNLLAGGLASHAQPAGRGGGADDRRAGVPARPCSR